MMNDYMGTVSRHLVLGQVQTMKTHFLGVCVMCEWITTIEWSRQGCFCQLCGEYV